MPVTVPLEVRATMRGRTGIEQPYGLDLAGLLAARIRLTTEHRTRDGGPTRPDTTGEDVDDLALPLDRCTRDPAPDRWHWLASCAIVHDEAGDPEPDLFYRRLDDAWLGRAVTRPLPYIHPAKGPYRDMMLPTLGVLARQLRWRAVGDPQKVAELLSPLRAIGRRHNTGEGWVLRWEVDAVTAPDPHRWVHVGDEGALLRPVPEACAAHYEAPHRLGSYAIRPPSWHPSRLTDLAMTPAEEM